MILPNNKSIFISRHVTHHDHILSYCNTNQPLSWPYKANHDIIHGPVITIEPDQLQTKTNSQITNTPNQDQKNEEECHLIHKTIETRPPNEHVFKPQALRRSTRPSQKPNHLSDFICILSKRSIDLESSGILYPIEPFCSLNNLSISQEHFSFSINNTSKEDNYREASKHNC